MAKTPAIISMADEATKDPAPLNALVSSLLFDPMLTEPELSSDEVDPEAAADDADPEADAESEAEAEAEAEADPEATPEADPEADPEALDPEGQVGRLT